MNSFEMTRRFHLAMRLPVHDKPREPTPAERILRAKLLMEETLETIVKGLGVDLTFTIDGQDYIILPDDDHERRVRFTVSDRPYDPVETLDGLSDVKVIANGTAHQFGLPLDVSDRLVYESNMSKLDDNGNPINNVCVKDHLHAPENRGKLFPNCELVDPTQPLGKVLKGPNFRAPDIAGFLQSYCVEHTARMHPVEDKTVCGRCGITVGELKP